VHKLCQEAAPRILDEFKPNLMVAIGGGGYVPARILRYAFNGHCTTCSYP
jgi:hypoxanthine phosphoribosyltransferase